MSGSRPVRRPGALGQAIAKLYVGERMSLREIARQVGLAPSMVERYLDGMGVARRSSENGSDLARVLRPAPVRCAWPGCPETPLLTRRGYRAGACSYHLKKALGLIGEAG